MYSYRNLQRDLEEIRTFSRTEVFTIGKSVMGKELWGIRVGDGTVRVQGKRISPPGCGVPGYPDRGGRKRRRNRRGS